MEIVQRKSINDSLKKYDYTSNNENDFIEVTEWTNGEGYDINIIKGGENKTISLTHGEIDAINYLRMSLDFKEK